MGPLDGGGSRRGVSGEILYVYAFFEGSQDRVISKRVIWAADFPWNPKTGMRAQKNRTTVPKTGTRVKKAERQYQKPGTRACSPKPPLQNRPGSFPLDFFRGLTSKFTSQRGLWTKLLTSSPKVHKPRLLWFGLQARRLKSILNFGPAKVHYKLLPLSIYICIMIYIYILCAYAVMLSQGPSLPF